MKIMYFNALLILILWYFQEKNLTVQTSVEWINKTKYLKGKIRNLYRKTLNLKNESVSVGPRPFSYLDFPGNDLKKLKLIEEVWNDYYDCLKTKNNAFQIMKTPLPYTVSSFVENSIQLDCNICLSPQDMLEHVEWYFIVDKPFGSQPIFVEEDEHKLISAYTFTLNLFKLQSFHQGIYYCKLQNDIDAPYFLHVLNSNNEPITEVKPSSSKVGPYSQSPLQIINTNIVLWNEWTDWTKCSRCEKVGKRTKIGYCKISLIQNLPEEIKSLVSSTVSQSFHVPVKVINETEELLKIFVYGIPCRSFLLPKDIRENKIVSNYTTQIMIGFCKVRCPSDVIVEVIDKNGRVIETYNNTAGEYYALQNLPSLPVHTELITVYADIGKSFILSCPSKSHRNTPVEWSVNGKIWLKDVVESVSKGRITLNNLNEIIFHEVITVDTKIYSCWQEGELVGMVRLLLNVKPSFIKEYLLTLTLYPIFMFTAIIITFLYVFIKMYLNQLKAKIGAVTPKKKKKKFVEFLKDIYHDKYIEKQK